jgi:hypothetical protein
VVKVRVLGCCNRAGVAGFSLALGWWVWLEWARGALSNGGIFKRIGAVLSFRLVLPKWKDCTAGVYRIIFPD